MSTTTTLITGDQLLEMGEAGRRFELVRGELEAIAPINDDHGAVASELIWMMVDFVKTNRLGKVYTELGVTLEHNPDTVRGPDICFVSNARLPKKRLKTFFKEHIPDLVVEVLSPSDRSGNVQKKIREYFKAGVRLIWIVDPENETVTAYYPSRDAHIYTGDETVSGEDVLPGFSFTPAELFLFD